MFDQRGWYGALSAASTGIGGGSIAGHSDPAAPILIALILIAFGAMLGGHLTRKFGQPAVLGELLVGVLGGNLAYYFHQPIVTVLREGETVRTIMSAALTRSITLAEAALEVLPATPHAHELIEILNGSSGPVAIEVYQFIDILSRIAIIILLFLVGLETSVSEMRTLGKTALLVAALGIVAPFLLGSGP